MNNTTRMQIVEGAVAKVKEFIAAAEPYSTSGTPNLEGLQLQEVAVADEEMAAIIEEVRQAIKVDEGRAALFEAAVGLVETLLKKGLVFLSV